MPQAENSNNEVNAFLRPIQNVGKVTQIITQNIVKFHMPGENLAANTSVISIPGRGTNTPK